MCDSEDISFIDEDPCDIIVDDNCDSINYGKENDNQDDNSNNMQQIVIKINNEIELTSIIVNTHNQSRGKRLNPDLSKNPSLQDHKEQDDFVPSQKEGYIQQPNLVGPVLESPESISPPSLLTPQRFNTSESESSSPKNTDQNIRFTSRRQDHSLLSRRNVLVRQEKLDRDFHPDLTRKRYSISPNINNNRESENS